MKNDFKNNIEDLLDECGYDSYSVDVRNKSIRILIPGLTSIITMFDLLKLSELCKSKDINIEYYTTYEYGKEIDNLQIFIFNETPE